MNVAIQVAALNNLNLPKRIVVLGPDFGGKNNGQKIRGRDQVFATSRPVASYSMRRRCRRISGIAIFSTPSGTQSYRRRGSRIFGGGNGPTHRAAQKGGVTRKREQLCGAPRRIALCNKPRRRSIVRRRQISRHLGVDDGLEIEVALPAAPNVDLPLIPFFSPFRGPKCERRAYAVVDIVASPRFVPLPRRSRQNNEIVDFTVNCCELL